MISLETERQIRAEWQRKADRMEVTFPYHHAYGFGDNQRRAAVLYALDHGVAAAAEKYRYSKQSIYNWLRDAKITKTTKTNEENNDVR